jgi:hypothetical protein
LKLGLPGLLLAVYAPIVALAHFADGKGGNAFFVVVPFALGLFLIWHGWPPKGSLSAEKYEVELSKYQSDRELYEKLWFCNDCGQIFKP